MTTKARAHAGFPQCLEDGSAAVLICDREGRLLHANPNWARLFETSWNEAGQDTGPMIPVHPEFHDKEFCREVWAAVHDVSKGYWRGMVVSRTKAGAPVEALLVISAFRDANGTLNGYTYLVTDISDWMRFEEMQRRQESLAAVRYFAERLAHEVGTALGVIRGRAELVLNSEHGEKKVVHAKTIVEQSDRVSRIITYLLSFCRNMEAPAKEKVKLRELIDGRAERYQQRCRELGVEIVNEVGGDERWLGDESRLRIILDILIENAFDAIEAAILAKEARRHAITIRAQREGRVFRIAVEDTGCGIRDEISPEIFQPFFTTKELGRGIGMGLALASQCAHDMGAAIRAESKQGNGSTFLIESLITA